MELKPSFHDNLSVSVDLIDTPIQLAISWESDPREPSRITVQLTPKEASELGAALIAYAIESDMQRAFAAAAAAQKPLFDGVMQ